LGTLRPRYDTIADITVWRIRNDVQDRSCEGNSKQRASALGHDNESTEF
jgi:hypothetical protein